jgi:hypothetical protein
MKALSERLKELNKVLAVIGKYTHDRDMTNNEIIKKEKVAMPAFYTARKKLQILGRVSKRDNREVLDPSDVTMEEYKLVGDPYRKNRKQVGKGIEKTTKKATKQDLFYMPPGEGKVHETLKEPIELPVYEHKSGAEITISGTVEGVIHFIKMLHDGVLG